jgi:hypothetical protein
LPRSSSPTVRSCSSNAGVARSTRLPRRSQARESERVDRDGRSCIDRSGCDAVLRSLRPDRSFREQSIGRRSCPALRHLIACFATSPRPRTRLSRPGRRRCVRPALAARRRRPCRRPRCANPALCAGGVEEGHIEPGLDRLDRDGRRRCSGRRPAGPLLRHERCGLLVVV